MKKSKDGIEIIPRVWYYLLDFNETDDSKTMGLLFNETSLRSLTYQQICELFNHALRKDLPETFQTKLNIDSK